jgi:hypothetical protein
MATLEDTVRSVVKDFIANEVLFTALDVSNSVKQSLPHAKHREVREVVRGMFSTDIETSDWARTPINVTLSDGTTAEALLYHPLSDSWDLDNKYSTQQRSQTALRPAAVAQATVAQAQAQAASVPATATPLAVAPVATVPVPFTTARSQWDSLFKTQPSLFPTK